MIIDRLTWKIFQQALPGVILDRRGLEAVVQQQHRNSIRRRRVTPPGQEFPARTSARQSWDEYPVVL